jgi:hypothetical protein
MKMSSGKLYCVVRSGQFLPDYMAQHLRKQSSSLLIDDLKFISNCDIPKFVTFVEIMFL